MEWNGNLLLVSMAKYQVNMLKNIYDQEIDTLLIN